jgi:hypothetical protein
MRRRGFRRSAFSVGPSAGKRKQIPLPLRGFGMTNQTVIANQVDSVMAER